MTARVNSYSLPNSLELSSSSSAYALRRKELLSLVKQLRAVGAQADLDLPRIAVIGNQSAGKSSVVEAISGINVPRDAGTCTRCPMECRLSSSDGPWSCQVSIRWEFDEAGIRRHDVREIPLGPPIKDKEQVETALRRAQAAVLNPNVPLGTILTKSTEELRSGTSLGNSTPLQFSRNVVCLDLVGPELTDLFFIDLPGIIQNAEPAVVKLVEDLIMSHIQGNSLILVALPMTDDIENQKALRLALQQDPAGRRTIGVLTKPDMLSAGSTKACENWVDVMEGRKHPLLHGYYCTRQPDDAQRAAGISSAEARALEVEFFANTQPWSTCWPHRFGTTNLVTTLSKLLTQIIDDTLPVLESETTRLLRQCEDQLYNMPKPVEIEPASHVLTLVTSCGADFQKYVEGGVDAATLVQATRGALATFKQGIKGTTPNFLPYLSSEDNKPGFNNYLEGEEEESFNESGYTTRPFFLEDMRRHIEKSITRELPDDVPFPCKVTLIKSYQGAWSGLAKTCFKSVKESTLNCLTMQVEEKFGPYTALKNRIMSLVTQLIATQEEKCMQYLDVVLQIETLPFTQNTFYYTSCGDKWLAKYKAAREQKESLSVAAKSGFPDPPRPEPDSSSNGGPFPLSLSSEPPLRRTLDEVSTTELPFTTASSVEAAAKLSVFGDSGPPAAPATGSSTAASNPSAVPISQARSTIGSSGTLPGISQPAGPFASQAPDSIFATLKPSPSLPSKGLFGSSGTLHPTPGGNGLATPSTPRTLVSVPAKPNISWPSIGSSASTSSGAPQTKPTPIGSSFFAVPPSSGAPASNPSNTNLPSPFAFSTPAPPKVNPSGTGPSILLSPAGSPAPDTTKPGSATPFGGLFSAQSSGAPQAKPSSTGSTLFPGLPGFASPTGSVTMKGGSTISYTGIFAVPHLVQPPPVQPHRVDISPFIGGFTKSGVCNFPEKSFEEMRVEALTARRPIKKAPNLKMKARATIPSAIVQSDASEQDYNDALSALAKIGITGLTKEDLGRLQPSDQYTRELNVMAQVRAYFGISYRRVIDNVPLIIDYMFVQALGKELQSFLISGLALGTADATLKCAAYLAEDPETRALREEVVARRRRLHDVALELRKIM